MLKHREVSNGRGGGSRRSTAMGVRDQGGWTLIELMISVAVIGLIMSALSIIIYMGVKSWNLQKDRMAMSQQSRTAAEIMSAQLRMGSVASVVISSSDVGGNAVSFSHLSFKRYDFTGTTWDTRFYMEQVGADTPAHLVYSRPVMDEATSITSRQTTVLAQGITCS